MQGKRERQGQRCDLQQKIGLLIMHKTVVPKNRRKVCFLPIQASQAREAREAREARKAREAREGGRVVVRKRERWPGGIARILNFTIFFVLIFWIRQIYKE
jgi:hypothetical protein